MIRFLRPMAALTLALASVAAHAWGNHTLAAYRALERMPEVASAPPVTVESLESFLKAEEKTIEAMLAAQEAWASANLEKYPPAPQPSLLRQTRRARTTPGGLPS